MCVLSSLNNLIFVFFFSAYHSTRQKVLVIVYAYLTNVSSVIGFSTSYVLEICYWNDHSSISHYVAFTNELVCIGIFFFLFLDCFVS